MWPPILRQQLTCVLLALLQLFPWWAALGPGLALELMGELRLTALHPKSLMAVGLLLELAQSLVAEALKLELALARPLPMAACLAQEFHHKLATPSFAQTILVLRLLATPQLVGII